MILPSSRPHGRLTCRLAERPSLRDWDRRCGGGHRRPPPSSVIGALGGHLASAKPRRCALPSLKDGR
eukprot:4330413-Pleurochrysis_carterae.AAC.1